MNRIKTDGNSPPELKNASQTNKVQSWFEDDFKTPLEAGIAHVFLFHGDINGLVLNPDREEEPDQPYIPLKNFLEKTFENGELVIFYNIASGIRFLNKEMEQKFKKIVGIEADNATGGNPVAAAKADLAAKRGIPREPELALPLLEKALRRAKNIAIVVNSIHFIAPAGVGMYLFMLFFLRKEPTLRGLKTGLKTRK